MWPDISDRPRYLMLVKVAYLLATLKLMANRASRFPATFLPSLYPGDL